MKIVLHATDILPKDPSLTEQAILLSLPYKEEESVVFKKALVVNYVINQLPFFIGLDDIGKLYQDRRRLVETYEVKEKLRKKQAHVTKEIGNDKVIKLNSEMLNFFRTITKPVSKEREQSLKNTWPYNLAFDPNDPLNQKFQKGTFRKRNPNAGSK
jgi:hypothetical protein